jgi:predicted type IV restriction endonuclease
MATREEKAKDRIKEALRKYVAFLETAKERNFGEADTSGIVHDMLPDVLGYNKYQEVTQEYRVKGQYADYAVKVDGDIRFFVEVKAVGTALKPDHLRQVTAYAVNEGVDWAVLTNGPVWQVYHIAFEKPINVELVFEVDLLSADRAGVVDLLYLISREAVLKDALSKYWADKLAVSAPNVVRALLSDDVINEMRKEFKRLTGYRLSPEEIRGLLLSQVVRPDVAEVASATKGLANPAKKRGRPPKPKISP